MTSDPVLMAYAARRNPKTKRVQYLRSGRAYPHNTGEGLTVIFDALPISFKDWHIVLLELDEADDRRLLAEARRQERERKSQTCTKSDQNSR